MPSLLTFRNVSLFGDTEYGISRVNIDIWLRKKYHFVLGNDDQLNTLLGLFENRYQPDGGSIYKKEKLFVQSDRLILGDKIYEQLVEKWLALSDEFFYFGGKRRSKSYFIDLLNAKHIRYFPIYKLKGEDRLKFALLSLTFQESGLILISKLLVRGLDDHYREYLVRLINETHCTLCLFSSMENPPAEFSETLHHPSIQKNNFSLIG